MSADGESAPTKADQIQGDLEAAHLQLARYAHDLREMLQRERKKSMQLEAAHLDTLMRLTRAAALKDAETGAHLERLSGYSQLVAKELGLSEDFSRRIATAAPLHDVGKIGIPESVLGKPSPLDEGQWAIVQRHPGIGASLLKGSSSPLIETARVIALTHHENWDGTGYPSRLRGEQTPIEGRIVMLVDCYDALRSERCYKPAIDHDTVCGLILEGSERFGPSQFEPRLLDVFRGVHGEFDRIYRQSGE
jgi:putative two-component system response regulator